MTLRRVLYVNPLGTHTDLVDQLKAAGWSIQLTHSLDETERHLDTGCCVALLGLERNFARTQGARFEHLIKRFPAVQWIGLGHADQLELAEVRALIGRYLFDYHTLPVHADHLLRDLGHAQGMARLTAEAAAPTMHEAPEHGFIGQCPQIRETVALIEKYAACTAPVLISGESGTGKELAASMLHELSPRSGAPFVPVNCGALPAELIHSELFGHEKGAFTGASQQKTGRLELADSGSIFLDEIGDLPMHLQVNFLRFLQEQTIERLGATRSLHLDVRVVAATHVDLENAVAQGRFREDLFYRLNVLHLQLPPLRERSEDIEPLANHFFNSYAGDRNPRVKGFATETLAVMRQYSWPGNIRELINRIRRALVTSESAWLTPADMGLNSGEMPAATPTLAEARAEADRATIQSILSDTRHNTSEAARRLNVSRLTLYRLMDKYDVKPSSP